MKTLKLVLEEDFSRKTKNELIEMLTALEKALSPSVYERISGISPSELKEVNKKEILEIIENFKKAYEPSWESAVTKLSADVMKLIFGQMAEDDKADKGRPGGRGGRAEGVTERTGDEMQNAARETTRAADEAARRTEDAARTGGEGSARAFDFGRGSGREAGRDLSRIAERASQNLATFSKAGSVLMQGVQEMSREWIGMTQEQMRRNGEAMTEMARMRTVPELVDAQADLMRDGIRAMVEGVRRIGEISLRTATETSDAMREVAAPGEERRRDAA